jgi:nucleotide-binding universal stress UspA family protein
MAAQGPSKKHRLLLATDLSARGDRALDRAAFLARQWDAELVVFHALQPDPLRTLSARGEDAPSWRRPPDPRRAAEDRIRQDLREEGVKYSVIVEEGDIVEAILKVVEREACDLIVLGTARDETLGRMMLGNTVDHLVRRSPVSVLVVKSRPRGAYKHMLVGTDFTDESRHGLEVAARAFPDAVITLMHAFQLPYRSLLSDSALSRDFSSMEMQEMKTFLDGAALSDAARARVHPIIEHGPPEIMFRTFVEERGADLTVIGAFGRGLMFHVLVGGNAQRIVDATPSDVLVVRAPRLGHD